MVYKIPLAEEKIQRHQVTALHLIVGCVNIGVGAVMHNYGNKSSYVGLAMALFGFGLLGLTVFKNRMVISAKWNPVFRVVELVSSLGLALYFLFPFYKLPFGIYLVLAGAAAFALYWERMANSVQYVVIDEQGIKLPSTSRKGSLNWDEVLKVSFRFGTLTIECAENRLCQWITGEGSINDPGMEQFCAGQIVVKKKEAVKNDW